MERFPKGPDIFRDISFWDVKQIGRSGREFQTYYYFFFLGGGRGSLEITVKMIMVLSSLELGADAIRGRTRQKIWISDNGHVTLK